MAVHDDVKGRFKDFNAARAAVQMTGIAVAIRCAVRDLAGLETNRCRVCRVVVGNFKPPFHCESLTEKSKQ